MTAAERATPGKFGQELSPGGQQGMTAARRPSLAGRPRSVGLGETQREQWEQRVARPCSRSDSRGCAVPAWLGRVGTSGNNGNGAAYSVGFTSSA
jgi:hypothetical protein